MRTGPNGECAGTAPHRHLHWGDAISIVLGIVIGAGIFRTPAVVAGNTGTWGAMLWAWAFGGGLCFCGAFTYAEMSRQFPAVGGEYVFLSRGLGRPVAFLFAWSRFAVIQTGSIAGLAFIFADYAKTMVPLGQFSGVIYAGVTVALLTMANAVGLRTGKRTQNLLTFAKVAGLLMIGLAAIFCVRSTTVTAPQPHSSGDGAFGLAMVFVLFTYGGWNEGAYLAGELQSARRHMVWVLSLSVAAIAALYIGTNLAYLRILGFEGMRNSGAVASDAMLQVFGAPGAAAVSILVCVSALGGLNGSIFTGARSLSATGADFVAIKSLGNWSEKWRTPRNALVMQGIASVLLVLIAGSSNHCRHGFEMVVEYTAPVFWFFLLLTGIAAIRLRCKRSRHGYILPLPLFAGTVGAFVVMCGYMLYSSIAYARWGAWIGASVVAAGVPLYWALRPVAGNGSRAGTGE